MSVGIGYLGRWWACRGVAGEAWMGVRRAGGGYCFCERRMAYV